MKRDIVGYLPVNIIQAVAAMALVAVFSRLLTTEEYGRYAVAFAATQLAQGLIFYWLHASVARFHEAARRDGRLAEHLSTTYVALAVLSLASIALSVVAFALWPTHTGLVAAAVAALVTRSAMTVGLETHRAARDPRRYSYLEATQHFLSISVGVLLVAAMGLREAAPLIGIAVANALCLLIDLPAMARMAGSFAPRRDTLDQFARYGVAASVSMLLAIALVTVDRFVIGWLIGDAAIGLYAVAFALADRPLSIIFGWIGMSVMPVAVMAMERGGAAEARAVMVRNSKILLFLTLPAATGLAMIAEPMAALLAGPEFQGTAAQLVPWLALAGVLHGFANHFAAHPFLLLKRTDLLARTMALACVAMLVLNIALLPVIGLAGAVVASVGAHLVVLVARLVWASRIGLPAPIDLPTAAKALAACVVMALVIDAVPHPSGALALAVLIPVGAVSYAAAALVLDVAGCRTMIRRGAR